MHSLMKIVSDVELNYVLTCGKCFSFVNSMQEQCCLHTCTDGHLTACDLAESRQVASRLFSSSVAAYLFSDPSLAKKGDFY